MGSSNFSYTEKFNNKKSKGKKQNYWNDEDGYTKIDNRKRKKIKRGKSREYDEITE